MPIAYLSDEWFDAAASAVAASDEFADIGDLGITHLIHVDDAGGHDIVFHLAVSDGSAALERGPASPQQAIIGQHVESARRIASGEINAQEAFIRGDIHIGGDIQVLIDAQPAFLALSRALAPLHAGTDFNALND